MSANAVRQPKHRRRPRYKQGPDSRGKQTPVEKTLSTCQGPKKCQRCGYSKSHQMCPAVGMHYTHCKKIGHFAKMCRARLRHTHRSRETYAVDEWSSEEDVYTVHIIGEDAGRWIDAQVASKSLRLQIDTGAAQSLLQSLQALQQA